jgi:hypothetical protein
VLHLQQPDATYTLLEDWLQAGRQVILHGQVRELRIPRLPQGTHIDASRLTARSIYIGGPPLENVRLHLHAPQGTVTCRTAIGPGTHLRIHAPGGAVRFGSSNPWQTSHDAIGPDVELAIVAGQVQADAAIRGERTKVRIECTPPARLHLRTIEQGALVEYRHAPGTPRTPIQAQAEKVERSAIFRLVAD